MLADYQTACTQGGVIRVLYRNMMHVWSWLFTPAVVLIGLTLLAVLQPQPSIGAVVAIVALAILFRPIWKATITSAFRERPTFSVPTG